MAERVRPDLVVISGDLTQRAKVREFERARAYLDRFPDVPMVVTPGNHDVPLYRVFERIFAPYRNYKKYIEPELDTVTEVEGAVVVALNSAAPHRAIVNGRIGGDQLAFAERAFGRAAPGDTRILVAHHHMAPAPDYEDDTSMPGSRRILDRCNRMGVELILGGLRARSLQMVVIASVVASVTAQEIVGAGIIYEPTESYELNDPRELLLYLLLGLAAVAAGLGLQYGEYWVSVLFERVERVRVWRTLGFVAGVFGCVFDEFSQRNLKTGSRGESNVWGALDGDFCVGKLCRDSGRGALKQSRESDWFSVELGGDDGFEFAGFLAQCYDPVDTL
jgi:3',5'-cyclic AMP phosphodiesterase CpdA